MKSFSVAVAALLVLLTRQSSLAFSPTTTQIRLNTLCLYATQKAPAHHEKWQPYFDLFVKYRDAHDGDLSGVMDADGDLGDWLQDQRKQYHLLKQGKKVRLTKKRAMALERAGAIPTTDDDSWKAKQSASADAETRASIAP